MIVLNCVCGGIGEWLVVTILVPIFGGCVMCIKKHLKKKECDCECHEEQQ